MLKQISLDDSNYQAVYTSAMERLERQAPWWKHREVSDPGITMIEMWAILCDMQSFYLDQIQESHYRRYLNLLGIAPDEGSSAWAWVTFDNVEEDFTLPKGMKLLAGSLVFETEEEVDITANRICSIYRGTDGYKISGLHFFRKSRFALHDADTLFSFSLEEPLEPEHKFSFYILLDQNNKRNPLETDAPLVSLAWEYHTKQGWKDARIIRDDTKGLLYSGIICLTIESPMVSEKDEKYEIRCRIKAGAYDEMPTLYKIVLNTFKVTQRDTLCCTEYGEFSKTSTRIELLSYLGRTGEIRVFAETESNCWKDITEECIIDPPISLWKQKRYVAYAGKVKVKMVCSTERFREEYPPFSVSGVTGQHIPLPWKNLLSDTVELMILQEGSYHTYQRSDPEEIRLEKVWHWNENRDEIILGDGRHGEIPAESENGVFLTSLALYEGEKGNVSIGRITHLEHPEIFPGLTCTNLISGKNGKKRKSCSEQFKEAEKQLKRMNRIITAEDVETLAKKTPGLLIKEAKAEWNNNAVRVAVTPKAALRKQYCVDQYRLRVENYLERYRPIGIRINVEIADVEK